MGAVGKWGNSMTGYLSESYVQEGEAEMRRKPYIVKQQQSLILAKRGVMWHLVDATVTCFCLRFAKIMRGLALSHFILVSGLPCVRLIFWEIVSAS